MTYLFGKKNNLVDKNKTSAKILNISQLVIFKNVGKLNLPKEPRD